MTAGSRNDPGPGVWTPQDPTGSTSDLPLAASLDWPTPERGWERRASAPASVETAPPVHAPPPAVPRPAPSPRLPAPAPSLDDLVPLENPSAPSFSADGRRWWDGTRWHDVDTPVPAPQARRGRRVVMAAAALGGVGLLVSVLGVVVVPAVLAQREDPLDGEIRQALAYANLAQQNHHIEFGMFADDLPALQGALAAPLVPSDVPVELVVVRATATAFCVAGAPVGADARWYVDETGEVTRRSCA